MNLVSGIPMKTRRYRSMFRKAVRNYYPAIFFGAVAAQPLALLLVSR